MDSGMPSYSIRGVTFVRFDQLNDFVEYFQCGRCNGDLFSVPGWISADQISREHSVLDGNVLDHWDYHFAWYARDWKEKTQIEFIFNRLNDYRYCVADNSVGCRDSSQLVPISQLESVRGYLRHTEVCTWNERNNCSYTTCTLHQLLRFQFDARLVAVLLSGKSEILNRMWWNRRSARNLKGHVSGEYWQRTHWISGNLRKFDILIRRYGNMTDSLLIFQIKSLRERESISTISRRTSKSVRALSMRKPKEMKMLMSEIWSQTKLLCKTPHLRNTLLTCAIQFGLTTRSVSTYKRFVFNS